MCPGDTPPSPLSSHRLEDGGSELGDILASVSPIHRPPGPRSFHSWGCRNRLLLSRFSYCRPELRFMSMCIESWTAEIPESGGKQRDPRIRPAAGGCSEVCVCHVSLVSWTGAGPSTRQTAPSVSITSPTCSLWDLRPVSERGLNYPNIPSNR